MSLVITAITTSITNTLLIISIDNILLALGTSQVKHSFNFFSLQLLGYLVKLNYY